MIGVEFSIWFFLVLVLLLILFSILNEWLDMATSIVKYQANNIVTYKPNETVKYVSKRKVSYKDNQDAKYVVKSKTYEG